MHLILMCSVLPVSAEIDNLAFSIGLSERVRSRVEEAGRVELTDDEATNLARSKVVHVVLIVAAMLVTVRVGAPLGPTWGPLVMGGIIYLVLWLGGLIEATMAGREKAMRHALYVTGSSALGVMGCFALIEVSTG